MSGKTKRCFRCSGRKKMFKAGSCYSLVNMGGVEVKCPLCKGVGEITIPEVVEKKKRGRKSKEEMNDERPAEA